jgi:hypothetical protein
MSASAWQSLSMRNVRLDCLGFIKPHRSKIFGELAFWPEMQEDLEVRNQTKLKFSYQGSISMHP